MAQDVQREHLEVKTALQAEENLDFSGFFTLSREKAPFFAVFRLRSQKALAIVPNGSDFSVQARRESAAGLAQREAPEKNQAGKNTRLKPSRRASRKSCRISRRN